MTTDHRHPSGTFAGNRKRHCAPYAYYRTALIVVAGIAATASAASPVASDLRVLARPSQAATVTLTATDTDGDTLSYIVATLPTGGTVTVNSTTLAADDLPYTIPANGTTLTFTADASTHGATTFTYHANDGANDSADATVTLNVNTAPNASSVTVTTEPDMSVSIDLAGTDADGDTLTYTLRSVPGHGILTASGQIIDYGDVPMAISSTQVTYDPDAAYHGPDTFSYKVADDSDSDSATVTITVNTAPTLEDFTVYVAPTGGTDITISGQDDDHDPITTIILSLPAHGALSVDGTIIASGSLPYTLPEQGDTVTYTIVADYLGTDSFHVKVADSTASSELAVVSIAINSPPAASDGTATVSDGQATIALTPTDGEGDSLAVTFTTLPTHGDLTVNAAPVTDTTASYDIAAASLDVTYDVDDYYAGTDVFAWQVTDGRSTAGPYAVTVTVPVGSSIPGSAGSSSTADPNDSTGLASGTDDGMVTVTCGAMGIPTAGLLVGTSLLGLLTAGPRRRWRTH